MDRFTIETTRAAEQQLRAIFDWVDANLATSRLLEDLTFAKRMLAALPRIGALIPARPGIRRLLLRRAQLHLYYSVEEARRIVIIRAVWHTARGEPPPL